MNAIYEDSNSIVCDLSTLNLTGRHELFIVRSMELLNITLERQSPIAITLNNNFSSSQLDDPSIQIESVQLNDQLNGLLLQLDKQLEQCSTMLPCELFFADVSQFESCMIDNSIVTATYAKDSNDFFVNNTKVRSSLAKNQCKLTNEELSGQTFTEIPIDNASSPVVLFFLY